MRFSLLALFLFSAPRSHAPRHPPKKQTPSQKPQPSAYFELLSPVGGADVDAIVDDLLADDEDLGEAELPALAMRRPAAVFATATGEQ